VPAWLRSVRELRLVLGLLTKTSPTRERSADSTQPILPPSIHGKLDAQERSGAAGGRVPRAASGGDLPRWRWDGQPHGLALLEARPFRKPPPTSLLEAASLRQLCPQDTVVATLPGMTDEAHHGGPAIAMVMARRPQEDTGCIEAACAGALALAALPRRIAPAHPGVRRGHGTLRQRTCAMRRAGRRRWPKPNGILEHRPEARAAALAAGISIEHLGLTEWDGRWRTPFFATGEPCWAHCFTPHATLAEAMPAKHARKPATAAYSCADGALFGMVAPCARARGPRPELRDFDCALLHARPPPD